MSLLSGIDGESPRARQVAFWAIGSKFGATLWTFDNGAKVYVLPTEHKKNDIRIYGVSHGGYDTQVDQDYSINTRSLKAIFYIKRTLPTLVLQISQRYWLKDSLLQVLEFLNLKSGLMVRHPKKGYWDYVPACLPQYDLGTYDKEAFDAAIQKSKAMLKASDADPLTKSWLMCHVYSILIMTLTTD